MNQERPERIAILGLGLIGGSLGLAIRGRRAGITVVGFDPDPAVRREAIDRGAIHLGCSTAPEAVADADLVILSGPVGTIGATLGEIAPFVKAGSVVTDTGSAKASVEQASKILPDATQFVGGHPMAGSERGGIASADPLLFENAVYVLCPRMEPGESSSPEIAPELIWLTEAVGARAVVMNAERHDHVVAAVSHLPQLLAVALVEHALDVGPDALPLAAGGFRDMTRIASSSFDLWGQILSANQEAVRGALQSFRDRLDAIEAHLVDGALRASFDRASTTRDAIPTSSKGFLTPIADVVVWAEDRPGYLHRLTGTLADAGLNVKDLELMRIREGEGGAFRLGLADNADAERAIAVLTEAGYRAQRR